MDKMKMFTEKDDNVDVIIKSGITKLKNAVSVKEAVEQYQELISCITTMYINQVKSLEYQTEITEDSVQKKSARSEKIHDEAILNSYGYSRFNSEYGLLEDALATNMLIKICEKGDYATFLKSLKEDVNLPASEYEKACKSLSCFPRKFTGCIELDRHFELSDGIYYDNNYAG